MSTPAPTNPPAPADPPAPLFQVVAGDPSPEELAALTIVLAAAVADSQRKAAELASAGGRPAARGWSSRSRLLRTPLTPGTDAWRRSGWPT